LNHQTALVEVREKFSMTDEVMERISKDMRRSPLVQEIAILNTCNRLEIYIISDKVDETVDVITN
jgi:glutamyl-tRNA reductase